MAEQYKATGDQGRDEGGCLLPIGLVVLLIVAVIVIADW